MAVSYDEMSTKKKSVSVTTTTPAVSAWDAMSDPNADKAVVRAQLSAPKSSPIIGKTLTAADLKKQTTTPTQSTPQSKNPATSSMPLVSLTGPSGKEGETILSPQELDNIGKTTTSSTPLMTALSTGKTDNVKANSGTAYKPLAVPTSAQKMANLGINFKPTAQSQINTINGISNKTITPTPIIPANTALNKVQFVSDNMASGAIKTAKGFVNELGYLGQAAAQGVAQSEVGNSKLRDYAAASSPDKVVKSNVTKNMEQTATTLSNTPLKDSVNWGVDFNKRLSDYGYDNNKTMQTIGNVAQGVGGMIPAVVSNFIVPGSGLFTMATGAAGNAAEEATARGADTGSALAYGVAIGVTEAATEKLFNGVAGVFGKGAADDVIKNLAKNVSKNETVQKAIMMLADTLGEGFEEWLTEYAEAYENKLLINQDSRSFKDISSDALYSAAIGSLVSVVMQGGNIANLSAKSAGEMAADDTTAKIANNVQYTAQTGANNVQKQTLTPNLNANIPNVNVQNNVSVPNTVQNAGQITPNLVKPAQNTPQQVAESPTINDNSSEVKLPSGTENTTEAKENAYNADVTEKNNNISKLEQALEYQNALYRNLRAEYQSGDIDTRRPELIDEAATQMKKVQQAETELQKARDDLQKVTEAHAAEVEATAKEAQTKADIEAVKNIVSDLNGRFVNENTLRQIEKIGALTNETAELRKAFDKATRLQAKANQLSSELTNSTSLSETIEIQEKLNKVNAQLETATQSLQSAQSKIANYPATATATVATKSPIFPENSLGAKIKNGMPQGTGAASKNSLGGIGATKPTRFDVNDDMNVDLNNLPKMSNQVVMTPQKKSLNVGQKLSKAYTRVVDVLNPIVKFSKATGDNTAMLASNAVNAGGTVSHIIENSLVDMNGNKIGKSLKEIAADIPKDSQTDFWNYMMQRRNIYKALEDKNVIANYKSSMSTQYVKNVEAQHPEWKKTGDSIVKWITDFQQAWGVDSGLIDQEVFNQLNLKDQSYVPAQREFSEIESALTGGEVGRKFIDQHSPIKKMEGSERDINNPLENIMKLVNTTVKTARYNQVGQSLLKTLRRNPKASQYGEIISKEEATASNANNIVTVIENGQKQYIRINDVDLLESLNGMPKSTYTVPIVSNLVTGFKKITTQDNPLFGITNLARDLPTGYIYGSQWNPIAYLMNEGKAFGQIATGGKNYQRYKAVGGGMSSFFSSADSETAALNLNKTKNVFQKVGIGFNKFNSMIEEATRLNEFSYVLGKTGDVQKALAAANDVTVNFARGGDIIKTVDRNGVPYLNASIQGLDKLGKAFMPERIAKTLFTGAVGITLPTLILYLINRDNPYYDELSNRTKDAYFVIPNMFGELDDSGKPMTFIKLPKSRELGMIFGALAERIARAVDGEEEAFKGFFSTDGNPLKGTIATNLSPANPLDSGLVGPMIGLRSNKDFAGRTIVPQSMQDRSAHLQFDEKTSELTKFIAEYASKVGIELSPKQMDYLIDSWTGVVGDFLLPATTKGANALSPITNKFTADPRYSSQTIANFYEKMDEAAKMANDKNFAEGLDSETVTLEEKISTNYLNASKEISALSKVSLRVGTQGLTNDDKKLLKSYGIDSTKSKQDIQKALRVEQIKIAKAATDRGTRADEMELDINNNSKIAQSVEEYQSAGITQKQAYAVYKAVDALNAKANTNEGKYAIAQTISKQGLTPTQQASVLGTLYTSYDKDGNITDESLLPYISNSARLLSLYTQSKGENTAMINMTIPKSFSKSNVEYELTDAEKKLYKDTYIKEFNAHITSLSTEANVEHWSDIAATKAKNAVINGR